jgi:hypothetical protein
MGHAPCTHTACLARTLPSTCFCTTRRGSSPALRHRPLSRSCPSTLKVRRRHAPPSSERHAKPSMDAFHNRRKSKPQCAPTGLDRQTVSCPQRPGWGTSPMNGPCGYRGRGDAALLYHTRGREKREETWGTEGRSPGCQRYAYARRSCVGSQPERCMCNTLWLAFPGLWAHGM